MLNSDLAISFNLEAIAFLNILEVAKPAKCLTYFITAFSY